MRFALLVALSHLRSRRREQGISVITFVSMLGVMVGVTALIMVLAVMEGFELDLRDKILGSNAHIVIFKEHVVFMTLDFESVLLKLVLQSSPNSLVHKKKI